MVYRIVHKTHYDYAKSVSLCHNLAHLTARDCAWQTRVHSELEVSTLPAVSTSRVDYFGNVVTFFTVQEPHRKLDITAVNVVHIDPRPAPAPVQTAPWEAVREALRVHHDGASLDAYQFAFDSQHVTRAAELADFAALSFPAGRPMLDAVLDLSHRIFTEFRFDPHPTTMNRSLRSLLEDRRGVCQDFAHLAIGCLRSLGLAARYVSGYLLTNPPPGQARLIGADMSHAWVSVFHPGLGWIDVDPTNDLIASEKHITLAWGRDYDDVSPIKGVILGGGRHTVSVSVDVTVEEPS
jgi:transglutaminase-like putative cysteine protease